MPKRRTTNEAILNSTGDEYMNCPNCGSFHLWRDLRDRVNSCHDCAFTHFVGIQTVREILERFESAEKQPLSDMRYCKKCEKETPTVHNDFMVAFCADCHTMRGSVSDYTGQKQPFQCFRCGRIMDETYSGQQVCSDCFGKGH